MTSRSPLYTSHSGDAPANLLTGDATFSQRGHWQHRFAARIGTSFDRRIVFEVGCFNAGFLCTVAAKHPTTGFVGIDWKAKSLAAGAEHIAAEGMTNVILLRGRAQDLRKIFADGEVDEMWVFHPEPCDEPNQLKNRLITEPFLAECSSVLRPGGSFAIKTDHPGYYQWVLGLLGLPEPAWFEAVRRRLPLPDGAPKVRARDLMRPEEVPARSERIADWFEAASTSADFWNDPAALGGVQNRTFAGEKTLFEAKFVQKRLPIYYADLRRR